MLPTDCSANPEMEVPEMEVPDTGQSLGGADGEPRGPLDAIGGLAVQEAWLTPTLRHVEIFTMRGLLTVLWHGDPESRHVVLACGGAMGGLLGPADGLYQDLGEVLGQVGIGVLRVGYRRPNDLPACVLDLGAAAELAHRCGAERFVTMGHSFGGAVAVGAAIALGDVAGVVTLATQSAGCEGAAGLGGRPLLLFHGDRDEILPSFASLAVREIAGGGELVMLPGAGHLLREAGAGTVIRERLATWIPDVLAGRTPGAPVASNDER